MECFPSCLSTATVTRNHGLTEDNVTPAGHFSFVLFCSLMHFKGNYQNVRFVSTTPPLIYLSCYKTNCATVPTVKRSFCFTRDQF